MAANLQTLLMFRFFVLFSERSRKSWSRSRKIRQVGLGALYRSRDVTCANETRRWKRIPKMRVFFSETKNRIHSQGWKRSFDWKLDTGRKLLHFYYSELPLVILTRNQKMLIFLDKMPTLCKYACLLCLWGNQNVVRRVWVVLKYFQHKDNIF